jgi:BolA protein
LAIPTRAERMQGLLQGAFAPATLIVRDDSARHAGHAGASDAGETHFHIHLVAQSFSGLSRVARSRAVHTVLQGEFETGLHALALELRSPDDTLARNP